MRNRKYITRITGNRVKGWYVRIPVGQGNEHSRLFSDSVYGSKEDAFTEAKYYRDEFIKNNPLPDRIPFRKSPPPHNSSGVVGVHWSYVRNKRTKSVYDQVAVATWVETDTSGQKQNKNKRFYLSHFDTAEECFQAACDHRSEMELMMYRDWLTNGMNGYSFYQYQ